jgi:hypothetical protein
MELYLRLFSSLFPGLPSALFPLSFPTGAYETASLQVYVSPIDFCYEAHGITLLSGSLCLSLNFFVLYTVRVISEQGRHLGLARISCFIL